MLRRDKMLLYQFYRRVPREEDSLIAVLPERRKNAERVTHQSIMNWARMVVPRDVLGDNHSVYFVQVEIE
jgi:hypothetical protein